MSSFNVENFNYDYAHKCYKEYASGNVGAADSMYEKGKEVAESKKWLSCVTKWQTEDVTVYDMGDGLDEHSAKDQTANVFTGSAGAVLGAAGGAALAGVAGGLTATTAITGTTTSLSVSLATNGLIQQIPTISQTANTGTLPAAIVYAAFGAIFLAMTTAFKVNAQNDRKDQEQYMKTGDEIMQYDYYEKIAEVDEMNNEMAELSAQASKITKDANVEVAAANEVAKETATSKPSVSVASESSADQSASKIIADLDALDEGILNNLPKLDKIFEELEVREDATKTIRQELPKFDKNRKQQILLMGMLAGGAALGAVAGGIGLGMAWTNYLLAPVAMGIFIAGIALFAASAVLAGIEIPAQNKSKNQLENEDTPKVNQSLEKASKAKTTTSQIRNAGLLRETAVSEMGNEAREEDANVNTTQESKAA